MTKKMQKQYTEYTLELIDSVIHNPEIIPEKKISIIKIVTTMFESVIKDKRVR